MAKFRGKDLYLADDDQIYFGDSQDAAMWYESLELRLDHTLSGIRAEEPYHMVRYDQLTEASGTLKNYIDEGLEAQDEFIELIDTPTTYSGHAGKAAVVNNTEDGLTFRYARPGTTATGTTPPDPGETNLWYNNYDHILYYWDSDKGKWLSVMSHYYMWTYRGAATGVYMSIGNISHESAYYYIPKNGTITSVSSSAQKSHESAKTFEIRTVVSGTILTFSHTNWVYRNTNIDVDLNDEDEMKCYITSDGQSVRNSIVTVEIKWRYAAP